MSAPTSSRRESSPIVITELRGSLVLTFPQSQSLSVERRQQIQERSLEHCMKQNIEAVILDLSALQLIDLTEWSWLRKMSLSIMLMGSDVWLVGLKPEVIISLLSLGAKIDDLNYALGVEEALDLIYRPKR